MMTDNKFYNDMEVGEGFDLEYYLPSLDADVILWVKLQKHGSVALDGTFNHQPVFKVLGAVDWEDNPVSITELEESQIYDWLEGDYWKC